MPSEIVLRCPEWLLKAIEAGLLEIPTKHGAPALNEINRQIAAQQAPAETPPTP